MCTYQNQSNEKSKHPVLAFRVSSTLFNKLSTLRRHGVAMPKDLKMELERYADRELAKIRA